MIIKYNGIYTKPFLKEFKKAFLADYETFETFLKQNQITTEEAMEILTLLKLI